MQPATSCRDQCAHLKCSPLAEGDLLQPNEVLSQLAERLLHLHTPHQHLQDTLLTAQLIHPAAHAGVQLQLVEHKRPTAAEVQLYK
jgi:hypothetical protein